MSKKMINTLAIVMAVAVAAMVWVQLITINKTAKLQEKNFTFIVNRALTDVSDMLDFEEIKLFFKLDEEHYIPDVSSNFGLSLYPNSDPSGSLNKLRQSGELSVTYSSSFSSQSSSVGIEMKKSTASILIPSMQTSYNRRSEKQSQDLRYQSFMFEQSEKPVADRVSSDYLKHVIDIELKDKDIMLGYKYAIKSQMNGKMAIVMGSEDYLPSKNTREYKTPIFYDENSPKPNFLCIYFPDQHKEQIKATSNFVLPSILLMIIIIGIFVVTLQIILRQKKLSQIKNDFINNMTHELKTPISTISLASQMLRDSSVTHTPTTVNHISGVILDESKRLSNQVEKVLQMAVFNESRLKLKFTQIDLNQILSQAASNFEIRVTTSNGSLTTQLMAEDAIIRGDEVHITNVIFNLLDNAEKYSKEEPAIEVITENKNGWVVVHVRDHGIGIPKEHQAQIFERFYRIPTGNVHNVKGFGLGLSYVKRIVDEHGGKIKIESTVGKGTRFRLFFPIIK